VLSGRQADDQAGPNIVVDIQLPKAKAEGDESTAAHCQLITNFTGLGVRPMPTKSPQAANQVHD
jgi:hypothetical protein